ncbi:MAG: DEAD/DEAH box helicase, partial [Gemmatimonadota bacterium]|nr:DEAD/DEAH box helicase [Gemmatimonadota bacterium]
VYRSVGVPLPLTMPLVRHDLHRRFSDLVARYMPFDLVIEEQTAEGHEARVSKTSVCGSWGAVAGSLRYFADRFGVPRASIEGTQLPIELVKQYAQRHPPELGFDADRKHSPVLLRRRVTYYGFELSLESEAMDEFPPEHAQAARHLLADAAARNALRHASVRRNQPLVEEIREVWRRLGGITPRLGQAELTAWYEERMDGATTWDAIRQMPMLLDRRDFMSADQLAEARALPGAVEIRDRTVPMDYDVEEHDGRLVPVVRLRVPEKLARTMIQEEVPSLDRPVRFVVPRGQRGSVRADTLDDLQHKLDLPFTDDERERRPEASSEGRHGKSRDQSSRGDHRGGRGGGGGRSGGGRSGGGRDSGGHRHPGKGRKRR